MIKAVRVTKRVKVTRFKCNHGHRHHTRPQAVRCNHRQLKARQGHPQLKRPQRPSLSNVVLDVSLQLGLLFFIGRLSGVPPSMVSLLLAEHILEKYQRAVTPASQTLADDPRESS